ncbi:MAG: hypothetical protein ACK5W9_08410 [Bdellovibrionales bacterium]
MLPRILLFIFFLASASKSLANEFWTDAEIYSATKEACSRVAVSDLRTTQMDKLRAGIFPSQKFNKLLVWMNRESAKKALKKFDFHTPNSLVHYTLNSTGFQLALNECYPSDLIMHNFFKQTVQRSELRGKFLASIIFLGAASLGQSLSSLLVGAYGSISKWTLISLSSTLYSINLGSSYFQNKKLRSNIDQTCGLDSRDPNLSEKRSRCLFEITEAAVSNLNAQIGSRQEKDKALFELLKREQELIHQIQNGRADLKLNLHDVRRQIEILIHDER